MDEDFDRIRRIEVTTAKVHDSQEDLVNECEVRYADKGYFGVKTKVVLCCHKKSHTGPSPISINLSSNYLIRSYSWRIAKSVRFLITNCIV